MCRISALVRQSDRVEVALIREIPTASEMVNGITVALGPVSIELTHHVDTRRIVVGRLEVLRLEQVVLLGELNMLHHDIPSRGSHAKGGLREDGLTGEIDRHGGRRVVDHDRMRAGHDIALNGHRMNHSWLGDGLLNNDGSSDTTRRGYNWDCSTGKLLDRNRGRGGLVTVSTVLVT